MYLDRDDNGQVNVVKGCFPTYAIGNITLGEERAPDVVLYVEDEMARSVVEPLVKLVMQDNFEASNLFPDVRVVPIGGFSAVVQYLNNHGMLLPEGTRSFALLDEDVKSETVRDWEADENHQRLADFQRVGDKLDFLPWSPELGIMNFLRDQRQTAERMIREEFGSSNLTISVADFRIAQGKQGAELRKAAKQVVGKISERIGGAVGKSKERAQEIICQIFVKWQYATQLDDMRSFFLPKLR